MLDGKTDCGCNGREATFEQPNELVQIEALASSLCGRRDVLNHSHGRLLVSPLSRPAEIYGQGKSTASLADESMHFDGASHLLTRTRKGFAKLTTFKFFS